MSNLETESIISNLKAGIEALLFVAGGPVSPAQLAVALEQDVQVIEQTLKELDQGYRESSGLRLQWYAGKVQLTTAAEFASLIERFLGLEATSKLSRAGLETLAIVAYQQPVTRPQLDAIRGVSSDGTMKNLLNKGLIQEIGRAEGPGRPILYGTTAEFLQYFGLSSIQDLPPLEMVESGSEIEKHQPILKD